MTEPASGIPSAPREGEAAVWVLRGKLQPPPQRVRAAVRTRLLARLDRALELPLTVIVSPPGFGKTTLLSQWHHALIERGDVRVAWLSLDEDDGEVSRFVAYLALALARAGVELGALTQAIGSQLHDIDARAAIGALVATIATLTGRLVLVLDDYDRVRGRGVDEVVQHLIRHGGEHLHVVLSSRTWPSLPLAELTARGLVERIEAQDLSLSVEEAQAVVGAAVPAEAARRLYDRTEGWAVALQLAGLWLSVTGTGDLERFSGRSVEIAAYLTEQVLEGLAPELREFLLETAILDRFDVRLANAVRRRQDSGELLARLSGFEGLLVPLDDEREWYRYHHLFAEFLRQQLRHRHPDRDLELNRRAAEWLSVHGDLLEAVKHAVRGDAPEFATGLVAAAGGWELVLQRGFGYVRPLLRHFDPKFIRDTPVLNITQAYLSIRLGEMAQARAMLEWFRRLPESLRLAHERDYVVISALLRDYRDEFGDAPGIEATIAQARARVPEDFLGRATLYCVAAVGELGLGDFAAARDCATRALEDMRRADSPIGMTYALLHLGQSYYYQGLLAQAEATYREALTIAEAYFGIDSALKAAGNCLLAQLVCQRGQFEQARLLLEAGIPYIESHDGWLDVFAAAYETAVSVARAAGEQPSAYAWLAHVERIAAERELQRLDELVAAWRLELLLDRPEMAAEAELQARLDAAEAAFELARRTPGCWRQMQAFGLVLARRHQLAGRSAAAVGLLRVLEQACAQDGRALDLARVRARLALALQARGELAAALASLGHALDYVAATQAVLTVLDAGPAMKSLLRLALQQDPDAAAGSARCALIQQLLSHADAAGDELLSGREIEVLRELCRGRSNKQIARLLNLSENTVKFHLKSVFRKLGVESRGAAVAVAAQKGLYASGAAPDTDV